MARCYGCQHCFRLVALKTPLSNVLNPYQKNQFGSTYLKWRPLVWDREQVLHKSRLAVSLTRISITLINSRNEALCTGAQMAGHLNMQSLPLPKTCKSNLNTPLQEKFENMIATKGRRSQFTLPTYHGSCRLGYSGDRMRNSKGFYTLANAWLLLNAA